jgi:hypothetical protein
MSLGKVTFYPNIIQYARFSASVEPSITVSGYACSGGETTGPGYDVADTRRAPALTIDCGSTTDHPTIDFDLSAAITSANFCIVDNHNLYTAQSNFIVHEGTTSLNLSYAYHGTLGSAMTNSVSTPIAVPTSGSSISLALFSTAQTSYNFDVYFTAVATTYTADITIGEIAIGKSYQISVAPDANPNIISNFASVSKLMTPGGQKYGVITYGERKAWQLSWSYLNATDYASLLAVWQYTKGGLYPMYIDLGEAATPALYYVRFVDNTLIFRKLAAEAYEVSVLIESEV